MTDGEHPNFRLTVFGCFLLSGPDRPVDLPNKKLACLLTYLACTAPVPQSRETLATLLWGSQSETRARHNLRQALFRLRRTLGKDVFISDGDAVSLAPDVIDCDAARLAALVREGSMDSLAAAAELYQGHLIDDVAVSEEGWNEWLSGERERLFELALDAMAGLGKQQLAAGRFAEALKAGRRVIALNNLREDAHRLIVKALAAAGRKAEALKHYQDLVALLRRELNAEPDEATQLLAARLKSAQPLSIARAFAETDNTVPLRPDRPSVAMSQIRNSSRSIQNGATAENVVALHLPKPDAVTDCPDNSEYRQLTILVCDMVDAMRHSAAVDPEDMRDRISSFHKMAAEVAARFGGFIAQYLSDGLHAYFGYPEASEHDAAQAVRAGLAMLDTLGTTSEATIKARIRIATGMVVVGEQFGTGGTGQRVAIGEAPNLAADLLAVAAPGKVIISDSTRRLVGRMFECSALDAVEFRGQEQPLKAWQVESETTNVSRFEARSGETLSPLIGRQEEIDLLLRRWAHAKDGDGRVVLLSGEPGIGKSRVAESLVSRLGNGPHARLRYFCSPHHTNSPLYPFITQLIQGARNGSGGGATMALDELEALLAPTSKNLSRDMSLFAELLAVPVEDRYPALAAGAQQKREMTLNAILDKLDTLAQNPVLIVFEDLHWIDPTSLDLLDRIIARIAHLPVLMIITFRPNFQPTWVDQPHVTLLPLNRLGSRDSTGIIENITREKTLPDAVVAQVLSHTDGVPLFIEELSKTLLESGLSQDTTDSGLLDGPLPPLAIPTTLQTSLAARLDRLGPAKDLALIGAAIGREFSHELIAAVSALEPAYLDTALERLTASGLISRRGMPPDASYSFKHALVRDAAYAMMLKARRQRLHSTIADVLIERFPTFAESHPEVIGYHFMEAGRPSEAVDHWVKAGRFAQSRWANSEAASFFEQSLRAVDALPETREALQQAIDLRFDLKASLIQLGEFERIFGCLREAEALARKLDDPQRLCQFSVHMCQTLGLSGNAQEAITVGQEARFLADSLQDTPLQVAASVFLGRACFSMLDYKMAEHHFVEVLQLLESKLHDEHCDFAGYPGVTARAYLARVYADRGEFSKGIALGEEGIRLAEALDHPYGLSMACWCLADLYIIRGELAHAIGLLERGLQVARQWNLPFLAAGHSGSLGYAKALMRRSAEGPHLLEQALSVFETMGHKFAQSLFLVPLGEACLLTDRLDDARKFAEQALELARQSGQRSGEAGALHLIGMVAARSGLTERAEGHYRDALALAEELEMRPLVARCRQGLGRLYAHVGKYDQARDDLGAAIAMYRDMGMLSGLEEAEAEIGELI